MTQMDLLNWINYQLNSIGFPILTKTENETLNLVYNLLQVLEKETNYSKVLSNDYKSLQDSYKTLETSGVKINVKNEQLHKELLRLELDLKSKSEILEGNKTQITKLKEEINSLKKSCISLKTQYNHESRQKAIQIEGLKDLINHKLNSQNKLKIINLKNGLVLDKSKNGVKEVNFAIHENLRGFHAQFS